MTALSLERSDLDMRRGACPALSAPMLTGDGLLARIALAEAISPQRLADICLLSARHGNGMIDISARGNLQVRGLTETTAPLLDIDIRALELPLREGLAVEVPPLAGLDPNERADPRPLAEAIRAGAREISGLAPKMSVAVDGQGQQRLSALLADLRLVAVSGTEWQLMLGGTEATGGVFGVVPEAEAVKTVLSLLQKLAGMGRKARGRDLADGLLQSHPSSSGLSGGSAAPERNESLQMLATSPSMAAERGASSPFNLFALLDGVHAVGIGLAFGQARAEELRHLAEEAIQLGIQSVKPALDHSLLFFGRHQQCLALQTFARDHDFIIAAQDARSQIAACPGSPSCASATIRSHEIAAKAAEECTTLLDGSFKLHVTGCPKGCAHPQAASLTVCGTGDGVLLIADAKAAGKAFASLPFADTNAALRRLSALVSSERLEGETSAACLSRLGPARLAAVTGQS